MSDLFHEDVPDDFIAAVLDTISRASQHTFQLLTKRPLRLVSLAPSLPFPENLWVGVSVENQRWTWRVGELRKVPASVRFLSCEPLLGPLTLDLNGIHWVIVGGESGPRARRMRPDWVRAIREQCNSAGVAFFFKQWGAFDEAGLRRGKGASGRLLDARTWDAMPQTNLRTVPSG
jgi:protein gp37